MLVRRLLAWAAETVVCTALGALTWVWWLRHPTPVGDYTSAQVAACVATLALSCLVLSVVLNPIAVGVGITTGFWLSWTRHAASEDPTGLYLVGSVLLLAGLVAGTSAFSATGWAITRALRSRHHPVDART